MKTILIMLAVTVLTAGGSYAQNKNNCCCTRSAHKSVAVHHKTRQVNKAVEYRLVPVETLATQNETAEKTNDACFAYRKHNIIVTECPGVFYDDANISYSTQGTFMGNYPNERQADNNYVPPIAPQHTTLNNNKGIAPADGNYCDPKCTPQ